MTKNSDGKITIEEAKKSLIKSGYLLENRLERVLIKKDYVVSTNYIYPDPHEKKPREIDLAAVYCNVLGDLKGSIYLNLIIECVNNDQPIAFFIKEPTYENFYPYDDLKLIGRPVKIGDKILSEYLTIPKFHHYYKGDISTQWCTFQKKRHGSVVSDEWMAFHYEDFHNTFQNLCFAIQYEMSEQSKHYIESKRRDVEFFLNYPIFVAQNEIYEIQKKGDISLSESEHIKYFRTEYISGKLTNNRIDIVTEEYFPKLLSIIEDEFQKTTQIIKEKIIQLKKELDEVIPT